MLNSCRYFSDVIYLGFIIALVDLNQFRLKKKPLLPSREAKSATEQEENLLTEQPQEQPKTLVLGIGNTLLSDEGIGVHVLEKLKDSSSSVLQHAEIMDGGTLSFTLAEPIENCDQFIVIDAAELKSEPGTVKVFENDEMDSYITSGNKKSVHEVSLADVMSITLLSGHLPEKRALVGIQPQDIDWGEKPTNAVSAAIPAAVLEIESLLTRWSDESK